MWLEEFIVVDAIPFVLSWNSLEFDSDKDLYTGSFLESDPTNLSEWSG